ncbi:SRPBCC family protein [Mycobacterium timonense]|uniref:Polyketide cyclase n=1 Tax=Mycobacterium timonense TaxID=701043 RepID=A0A7I9Z0Y5_9MYCO|nr:SRPBCC family protein [Mycobacterium timonense]GFG94513.1 polyketide cyclase [Mycobacterium timonense]
MVAPLLQAHVDINAPVAKVWELVSDLRRMPEWSPQCRWMKPFGPVRQGTRTLNLNRRNRMFWPTTCTVVEIVPDRKLAFRVDTNNTIWSYELEPAGEGTRVIESRHAENGVTAFSNLSVKALFGGTDNFEHELLDGMNASLARIKAAAEDAARG